MTMRDKFEEHRASKNGGKKPKTWAQIDAADVPDNVRDRYLMREDQAAWEAWQACAEEILGAQDAAF